MENKIADMRRDYDEGYLVENSAPANPFQLFNVWFEEALATEKEPVEPNAMVLSSIDEHNKPQARVLLLKEVTSTGFVFFTNYNSPTGVQLKKNPNAAITFFWPALARQVRIDGLVERISSQQSDIYFQQRPKNSQLGAWASNQSEVLQNRAELDESFQSTKNRFEKEELYRPAHWGGYCLVASRVEFWQGRPSRLHDRLNYRLTNNAWVRERLAP